MADGLFNLSGRRTTQLTKDNKTYTLTIQSLADYGRKEAAILSKTGNPWEGVESIKDHAVRTLAIKAAADAASRPLIATMEDENQFDHSIKGMAYLLWRSLSVVHPQEFPASITTEQGIQLGCNFIEWFGDIQAICRALYTVQEKDILGN